MKELNWRGCYSDNLKGKIIDEAFSHPAKMAWGLTMRIFQHLFDEGWLKEGELVADPFGGIATTGLAAASFGCPCILVELEEKFVDLAEQNLELHREQWEKMGKPHPIILQGDSRQFSSIIREAVDSIITSPPFIGSTANTPRPAKLTDEYMTEWGYKKLHGDYGDTEGQIGAMKEGKLDEVVAVITSPPFPEQQPLGNPAETYKGFEHIGSVKLAQDGYGQAKGQLGKMKEGGHGAVVSGIVTSPPYASSMSSSKSGIDWSKCKREDGRPRDMTKEPAHATRIGAGGEMRYSPSPDNMGNLPEGSHEAVVDAVVTSPPYEHSMDSSENAEARAERADGFAQGMKTLKYGENPYSFLAKDPSGLSNEERHQLAAQNPQIGQKQGDTYWEAVSQVYQECFKALKANGICCIVVKAFVRNKQIVDLPSQTLELLEAIGFEPLERIRAWMVSPATQASMMPDVVPPYRKEKKSFFRRLAEKRGSPRIDWEEVLVLQKPRRGDRWDNQLVN